VPLGEQGTQLALALPLATAPELPALSAWDRLIADYATTGVAIEHHPMQLLRPGLERDGVLSSRDLDEVPHGQAVRVGGLVMARQRPGTANGVSFLLLEDEFGTVNLIVPPPVYERHRMAVRSEPLVVAAGTLERFASAGGAINIVVRSLRALESPDQPLATVTALPDQAHEPVPLDVIQERKVRAARAEREEGELVAAAAGGGDFRAVAPPVMSFAQGRRR
jgi:error-prone DNA polymerase